MKFSVTQHVKDNSPVVHSLDWQTFSDALLVYEYREQKLAGALFSPAEFNGGKEAHNVVAVHFGVLDVDGEKVMGPQGKKVHGGVPAADFFELLKLAGKYDAFTYTTWSQPFAASREAWCARLVVPFSRPVLPSEWAVVRARFVAEFGGKSDSTTDDATRCFFTPALPTGSEWAASVWRSADWAGGSRTWDVDAALRAGPITGAPVPVAYDARDPIPRDAVARLAARLSKAPNPKRLRAGLLMRTGLDGHKMAESGGRHEAKIDVTWALAVAFPSGSAVSLADHFRLSLDLMREDGEDDPLEKFIDLIESAQRKVHAEVQEATQSAALGLSHKISIAYEGKGTTRTQPYTTEELATWETDAPLAHRWILQVGSAVWVFFDGAYIGPFQREAIGTACVQWLAPAVAAGVNCHTVDEKGKRRIKDLGELVGSYGRVCTVVEADMSARSTYLDAARQAVVEAPCPLRALVASYDDEVDQWLRLLAGKKYARLCDWLATCTWLRECAPAVFLKGASGAGKNLLASGLARLWTPSGFTPMTHALGQFNASITRCPLVYADERVPETFKGEPRTEELRELITTSVFQINQKNRPLATCYGSARVIIGANNFGVISRKAEFTPEDAQALADRFILIDVGTLEHCPARDWLIAHGGAAWGETAVSGDRIARHALWLRDEVESGRRPFTRGGRMVVPGDAAELMSALQTGSKTPWDVLSWVWEFLHDQQRHIASSAGRAFACFTQSGQAWVAPRLLLQAWEHYMPGERAPSFAHLTEAVRGLLKPQKESRMRKGGRGGERVTYQEVRIEQLTAWAEAQGKDVSDMPALLAVDTDAIGVPGRASGAN